MINNIRTKVQFHLSRLQFFLQANPHIKGFLFILALVLILPITIGAALTFQNIRQKASGNDVVVILDQGENPISQTSDADVKLRITLPSDWHLPGQGTIQKSSPIAYSAIKNIIPQAFAYDSGCPGACRYTTDTKNGCTWQGSYDSLCQAAHGQQGTYMDDDNNQQPNLSHCYTGGSCVGGGGGSGGVSTPTATSIPTATPVSAAAPGSLGGCSSTIHAITGFVRNQNHEPVANVTVCIDPPANGDCSGHLQDTTDGQGYYSIAGVPSTVGGHNVYVNPLSLPQGFSINTNPIFSQSVCNNDTQDFTVITTGSGNTPTATAVPQQPPTGGACTTTITISGSVRDQANNPITGAKICLDPTATGACPGLTVVTDTNGMYRIPNVPPSTNGHTVWVNPQSVSQGAIISPDGQVSNTCPRDDTVNFTVATGSLGQPTATTQPGVPTATTAPVVHILSSITIENKDNGTGGTSMPPIPAKDALSVLTQPFKWKLNPLADNQTSEQRIVQVTLFDGTNYVPFKATVTLTKASASVSPTIPTVATGSTPSLRVLSQANTSPNFPRVATIYSKTDMSKNGLDTIAKFNLYVTDTFHWTYNPNQNPGDPNKLPTSQTRGEYLKSVNPNLIALVYVHSVLFIENELESICHCDYYTINGTRYYFDPRWYFTYDGSFLEKDITADDTVISVNDVTKFNKEDHVIIGGFAGQSRVEVIKIKDIRKNSGDNKGDLVVERGLLSQGGKFGPIAHKQNDWAKTIVYTFSDPSIGVVNMTASAIKSDANPELGLQTWNEFLASFIPLKLASHPSYQLADGVFLDNFDYGAVANSPDRIDLGNINQSPKTNYKADWEADMAQRIKLGMQDLVQRVRAKLPSQWALNGNTGGNDASIFGQYLNGGMIEGINENGDSGLQGDVNGGLKFYNDWGTYGRKPNMFIFEGSPRASNLAESQTKYQAMRYLFALTLTNDGYFAFDENNSTSDSGGHQTAWWYDEYDDAGKQKGYLGKPLGPATQSLPGVYRRDFTGGISLANTTPIVKTIDLKGTFQKIKGTQVPKINDGSIVTSVTLQPKDGIILLSANGTQSKPPPCFGKFNNVTFGYGDIDGDGVLTQKDYDLLRTGSASFTADQQARVLLDGQTVITPSDLGLLGEYLGGKIITFPICSKGN